MRRSPHTSWSVGAGATEYRTRCLGAYTLWRYGTSVSRPLLGLVIVALITALLLLGLPILDAVSGVVDPSRSSWPLSFDDGLIAYFDTVYFLLTAPAGVGTLKPVGLGKIVFASFLIASLVLLSLAFQSATRRLSRLY
jgi:hypothetical protein